MNPVKKRLLLFMLTASAVVAYANLEWKFEGSTVRSEASGNSGALESGLDTSVSSVNASEALETFSTFPQGMTVIVR